MVWSFVMGGNWPSWLVRDLADGVSWRMGLEMFLVVFIFLIALNPSGIRSLIEPS